MAFPVTVEICSQCPLSKRDMFGVYIAALRCSVCHCFISAKEIVKGKCPKFDTVEAMRTFAEEKKRELDKSGSPK